MSNSAYPDLAKVEDWLNGRGYTGEAGSCHAAMDEIRHLRAENEKLRAKLMAATGELCDRAAAAALKETDG